MSTDQAAIDRLAAEALGRYRLDPDSTVISSEVRSFDDFRKVVKHAFHLRVPPQDCGKQGSMAATHIREPTNATEIVGLQDCL